MIWKKQPVGSKLEALDSKINFIDTTTVINNLDNIPLNAQGRITLGASVSPTGNQATFDFHCFGNSAYRGLTIINTYSNTMFFNSRHNSSTWKGWEQLALNSNLGSPSSASSVTGADAFSKINSLNSNINTNHNWHQITGVQENVEIQIPTSYREVYIDCQFSAGQHICFHLVPGVRQDSGFYYNSNACAGGAASLTAANKLTIFHPYYGGSSTTFSSITAWGR